MERKYNKRGVGWDENWQQQKHRHVRVFVVRNLIMILINFEKYISLHHHQA